MPRRPALLLALIAAAAVAAPGTAAAARDARPTKVTVSASEWSFTLSRKSVRKGPVLFLVINRGLVPHDFMIAGQVTPTIPSGQTATIQVVLRVGRYPYRCTFPGHAAAGMHGVLRVTG
jgi:uncharacterized cupredoxin-like copper-binding protein